MFSLRSGPVRIALWITVNPSSENRQKQIKERTEEDKNASGIRVLARQPGGLHQVTTDGLFGVSRGGGHGNTPVVNGFLFQDNRFIARPQAAGLPPQRPFP